MAVAKMRVNTDDLPALTRVANTTHSAAASTTSATHRRGALPIVMLARKN